MKKIINRKKYDTETAKELGGNSNGMGRGDFRYIAETLYQKKNGEFFLHGAGGAMTEYAESYADGRGFGERIIPITEEEARDWVEKNLDAEDYEEIFGEVEE